MIALDDPPVWTRTEAIARLREGLLALCDDEHSMCEVAASRGIFCRGFQRWHEAEFHRKWRTALGQSTHLTRAQLERLANIWQMPRCPPGPHAGAGTNSRITRWRDIAARFSGATLSWRRGRPAKSLLRIFSKRTDKGAVVWYQ